MIRKFLGGFVIPQLMRNQSPTFSKNIRILYNSKRLFSLKFSRHKQKTVDLTVDNYDVEDIKDSIEHRRKLKLLVVKFQNFFNCSEEEASEFVKSNENILKLSVPKIATNIEFLFELNITAKTIMENPWLINGSPEHIQSKIDLILELNPQDINDFASFIWVPNTELVRAIKINKKEKNLIPERNRVYYFSKQLNVEPALVSQYFSSHMFMMKSPFNKLNENLNVMLEYEIDATNILRDLWALTYSTKSLRARLERSQKVREGKLMPWMVHCSKEILQRSLTITEENKNLVGNITVIDYLSQRLGYDKEMMKFIVSKNPGIARVRPIKVKEFLDYLLDEEKFQPIEVFSVIQILFYSLETVKKRISELKSHGCRPTSLIYVCKSQKEYRKFLEAWIDIRKKKGLEKQS